ncbi:MMPL family transporter [bacterium]|nr:MMPL family transporter [bacterium]
MSSSKAGGGLSYTFLKILVGFAYRAPRKLILLAILSCVLCIVYAARNLEFATDRAALVDQNEKFGALSRKFQKEFPNNEDLIVVIDGGNSSQRERFSDELASRLKEHGDPFKDIFQKVELPFLRHQALLYLETEDLQKLLDSLRKAQGMVSALSSEQGVGQLLAQTTKDLEQTLPVLNGILSQLIKSLQTRGRYEYESPWQRAFFEGDGQNVEEADLLREAGRIAFYNTLADGRIHLLMARPTPDAVSQAIATVRKEVKRLKPAYPELEIGITGELVLDEDEMQSSITDSTKATLWSLVLVILMFGISFHRPARPAMALFALAISVGWTIGYATLAIGHLNLLTVTFATMLIGLGADFGIHFIYGYEEERARGLAPYEAMLATMDHAGVENATGAVTTAIAFWAICFTDFRGVAELGLIAGAGVLLSFLAMASVLPAMIFLQESKPQMSGQEPRPSWAGLLAIIEDNLLAYPRYVLALCLCFTLWCGIHAREVKFDFNLLHLQSPILQSVQTEMKLLSADEHGVLFAVSLADNLEMAEKKSKQFSDLKSVARVESVIPLVPKNYPEKAPLLQEIAQLMENVPLPNPEDAANSGTRSGLMKMGDGFMLLESAFREAYPRLIESPDPKVRQDAKEFKILLNRLFATLEKMGPGPISDGVTTFQFNLYGDLRSLLQFLKDQRADRPITLTDLPVPIKLRSIGQTGKILLRIYPKGNPWERDSLGAFVKDIQNVDPDVIGTPVMVYYHTAALKRAFELSGWYALSAIAVILLLHFRNLKNTLLALMPKVVGVVWMLGLMAYYRVDFNPANFMALPLILGIGLIFGVHVVHRLLDNPHEGIFNHSTGPAIALSAGTTMAGFGTLMIAHHQGIASLGFLMTAGVGANLVTSLLLLPAFMRVISKPQPPVLDILPE